jgi:hypothetical protein
MEDRIDRSAVKLTSFAEADADDLAYWLGRSPSERIAGIEHLRRWLYGDAAVDARVQKVLTVAELDRD